MATKLKTMNDNKYWIIIKTGEAEIRALENAPKDILSKTIPLIEITRGRKVTKNNIETYPFYKRIAKLKEIYKGNMIAAEWMYHPYHFEMYQS